MKYVYLTMGVLDRHQWKPVPYLVFSNKRMAMAFLDDCVKSNVGEWKSDTHEPQGWVRDCESGFLRVIKQPVFTSIEDAVKGVTE